MRGMTLAELMAWQPPYSSYIIEKGILVPGTKMAIFGRYQTWKSMITIDAAFCIGTGKPWLGFKTAKTTSYVVQAEIPQAQFRERVAKYALGNKVDTGNVYLATEPYIKLDKGFGVGELDKELSRTGARLLIIDPVFKMVSGRLTDEYDMRQFFDRMDLLAAKYNFSLILIHHDRKHLIQDGQIFSMGAEDMFGSYMQNWCDTIIRTETTDTDGEVKLTFEKVRHSSEEIRPILVTVDRDTLRFSRKEFGKKGG